LSRPQEKFSASPGKDHGCPISASFWVITSTPSCNLLETIAAGDWSDGTQDALKSAIAEYADDFGYDLDEDGAPLSEDDAPTRAADGVRATRDGDGDADGDEGEAAEGDAQTEEAGAVSA
jgi:F-type H+-transporting ATPase subunit alpha